MKKMVQTFDTPVFIVFIATCFDPQGSLSG